MAAVSQPMTADPSHHRQELNERLDSLRRLDSFCDVTIAVKGKEFKAHKAVLAAAAFTSRKRHERKQRTTDQNRA